MMRLPDPDQRLLKDLLEGEKVYPLYSVRAKWPIDIDYDVSDYGDPWFAGLPRGQIWNSAGWTEMPKQPRPLPEIIEETTKTWWPKYKYKGVSRGEPVIVAEFVRWEVWSITWFSHWTHDIGFDDQQVLRSFDRFVDRMKELNRREGSLVDGLGPEPYCLMGAEDRFRWYGRTTGHPNDEQTDPPCRCPACKKRGVVTVGH